MISVNTLSGVPYQTVVWSTREILKWPIAAQNSLREELNAFFPQVFRAEKDWRYVVRHYFYDPAPAVRWGLLVRNSTHRLVGTAIFDLGATEFNGVSQNTAYVHIRALMPETQTNGLGRAMSRWMLHFDPNWLFSTCMQPASLYSWVGLVGNEMRQTFSIWPRREQSGAVTVLPPELLGEAFSRFTQIYRGHVKGDIARVEAVVQQLTVRFIRRNVGMEYEQNPWIYPTQDAMAEALKLQEGDGVLVVVRKHSVVPAQKTAGSPHA